MKSPRGNNIEAGILKGQVTPVFYRSLWKLPPFVRTPEQQHKFFWRAFPDISPDSETPFRFRVNEQGEGVLVSRIRPESVDGCLVKVANYEAFPSAGGVYHFSLKANTTTTKGGKRVTLTEEQDILEWLERKLNGAGRVLKAWVAGQKKITFERVGRKSSYMAPVTLAPTEIEGVVECIDPEAMRNILVNGVGSAKGFGMGVMFLKRLDSKKTVPVASVSV